MDINKTPTLGSISKFDQKDYKTNTLLSTYGISNVTTLNNTTTNSPKHQSYYSQLDTFFTSKHKAFYFAPIFETSNNSFFTEQINKPFHKYQQTKSSFVKDKSTFDSNNSDSFYNEEHLSQGFNSCREVE